ncbi:hypothetical protein DFP90_105191 [Aestuariispira insulae]|uniref:Uncharacterized protein n=2 Tax=Aestuariispira insulae TaxID=1461337 RepID=A0A3D9HJY5_9PROT|nr:GNAT family N-acetyltransferase [Aestuariispira insulae]RED49819.1 hypothetical protein DFP90_105191 [Aestuariispira insulae]
MPDGGDSFTIATHASIAEIDPADWDACAGADNPFVSHAFLKALEESGSVRPDTGWGPHHLSLRGPDQRILAVAPLYLKGHSHGEYVFDWGWADAYERAGGQYYPKLLSAVPFTPVTGPRLMVRHDGETGLAKKALASGMMQLSERYGLSSIHINFLEDQDMDLLEELGFLRRTGMQFHWHNDGYESFDDFLDALASRKRKSIRKERDKVKAAGIEMKRLTGDELKPHHWDHFYQFYIDTYDRKWGAPYLTRAFFDILQARMADKTLLVMAYRDDHPIAGALNLIGSDTLYGRNWGCDGNYKFLHFEACYYQAIDFAIERGLKRVEAGTQGQHKLQRGYLPTPTWSAHWCPDPSFTRAIERFLIQERREQDYLIKALSEQSPFKREN